MLSTLTVLFPKAMAEENCNAAQIVIESVDCD
jgi:hypothetical protein